MASHMRSNSSVLSHVLGSNPEISGYAELSLAYRSPMDFLKARCKVHHGSERSYRGRYLLDKVLHDEFVLSEGLFVGRPSRIILLLRRPDATIRSILNMGARLVSVETHRDPRWVTDYYCTRLKTLERYAEVWQSRGCVVRSEEVVESTASVLSGLTNWLELREPLKSSYSIFKHTGAPRHGDPSKNIKLGEIVRPTSSYEHIQVPRDLLREALEAYSRCLSVLESNCLVI